MNASDEPLNLRKADLAVVTGIAFDLNDVQQRIVRLAAIQQQRIDELRATLDEWRKPMA